MEAVVLAVGAVAAVFGATALAKKTRIGAPLLLLALGMGVSLLPFVPEIEVEPEWILAGVLPPLLYSAAVRTPVVDLRRNLAVIGGLSVVLVLITAVLAGLAIHAVFPRVPLHVAIALGAVLSPTDAAATAIVKRAGAPARVATVLDGEALLNDATSLVTLRTAIAGAATFFGALGDFLWAVGVAGAVGLAVGWVCLRLAGRIDDPVLHTLFSFLVPFAAYLPVEWLGSSGLASVVAAGLVMGHGAHRFDSARNRLAQRANWQTVEVLAEGAVFLAMGLQVFALYQAFQRENDSVAGALLTALVALAVVLAVRGVVVTALLGVLGRGRGRAGRGGDAERGTGQDSPPNPEAARLGWREGVALEWAGLRGVVTLAAAQTLPLDTPERPALALIAFAVAAGSLLLQGLTLRPLLRRLGLTEGDPAALAAWRTKLRRRAAGVARRYLDGLGGPDGATAGTASGAGAASGPGTRYSGAALELARSTAPWVTVPDLDDPPPAGAHPSPKATERAELRELRLAAVRAMRRDLLAGDAWAAYPSRVLAEALEDLDQEELAIDL
ncbi:MAG: sodium:proton antiporter [Bifidobacteriaceae bacterium]|nr:sodium:proton antiporter [Bifidobacteriaceae bacterium]